MELTKLASFVELLLDDNNNLRKFMISKDSETCKVLMKIDESNSYNLTILQNENKILKQEIDHFAELNNQLKQANDFLNSNFSGNNSEKEKMTENFVKIHQELEVEKHKVKYLGEQKTLIEPSFYELKAKYADLEQKKTELETKTQNLQNKNQELIFSFKNSEKENEKLMLLLEEKETENFKKITKIEKHVREIQQNLAIVQKENSHLKEIVV